MSEHVVTDRGQRDSRLNLRASQQQQQLIRRAAAALDKSMTEFVLESATSNAERVLADRRWFVLSGEDWERLEALLDAPALDTPKLKRLLSEPTVFDQATDG
ncbi:MAG: DUF1778 domain-containing protein [Actinobacteria bacterium]|nr:DUF1778 domain-containing protein [Actinomycetota bacterium]MBV9254318.1 DUF1778 domain-containing protein [Actinomycetota bacterium]